MNTTTKLLGSLLITATVVSCGTGSQNHSADVKDPLANCPVVGQYVQVGNDKVMSCDQKLLTDTVPFGCSGNKIQATILLYLISSG